MFFRRAWRVWKPVEWETVLGDFSANIVTTNDVIEATDGPRRRSVDAFDRNKFSVIYDGQTDRSAKKGLVDLGRTRAGNTPIERFVKMDESKSYVYEIWPTPLYVRHLPSSLQVSRHRDRDGFTVKSVNRKDGFGVKRFFFFQIHSCNNNERYDYKRRFVPVRKRNRRWSFNRTYLYIERVVESASFPRSREHSCLAKRLFVRHRRRSWRTSTVSGSRADRERTFTSNVNPSNAQNATRCDGFNLILLKTCQLTIYEFRENTKPSRNRDSTCSDLSTKRPMRLMSLIYRICCLRLLFIIKRSSKRYNW